MFKGINVVYYYVTDLERAKKFYGETLGLPLAFGATEMGWFEFGGPNETHIAISHWLDTPNKPPARGGATVTFTVDDAHKTTDELKQKGVKVDNVEEIGSMVRLGTFYDPDGNRIQFAQNLAQG
jgi:catechol 2,3-dioxygenase-like lactoylglutathione lyase family enzyme